MVICLSLKVRVVKKKGPLLQFILDGTDPAFANSLRRVMISEIPTLAVEWIDVHENNSPLFDEVISHRMGLIPLKFEPGKISFPADCKCGGKGCPSCQVVFIVDKKGPCLVTSGDMKSSDKKVAPIDPKIPIVKLLEGHYVKLEAIARLGIGNEHAKHHAANASYQYYPEITSKGGDLRKAVKACPRGVLSVKSNKLVMNDPTKCNLCRSCMEAAEGVVVKGNENKIIFSVETISGLKPEYIVTAAADIIGGRAKEFKKKLEKA